MLRGEREEKCLCHFGNPLYGHSFERGGGKKRTKICNRHMLEVFMLPCFNELLKFGGEETDPLEESREPPTAQQAAAA